MQTVTAQTKVDSTQFCFFRVYHNYHETKWHRLVSLSPATVSKIQIKSKSRSSSLPQNSPLSYNIYTRPVINVATNNSRHGKVAAAAISYAPRFSSQRAPCSSYPTAQKTQKSLSFANSSKKKENERKKKGKKKKRGRRYRRLLPTWDSPCELAPADLPKETRERESRAERRKSRGLRNNPFETKSWMARARATCTMEAASSFSSYLWYLAVRISL